MANIYRAVKEPIEVAGFRHITNISSFSEAVLNEKGYYFTILLYGLFSAVSLQKSVRDKLDGIAVTGIYFGLCWASVLISILLLGVGLAHASLTLSEKGFYGISFLLSLFAAVAVQKNTRDLILTKSKDIPQEIVTE